MIDFATAENPLRCSNLPRLVRCPMQTVLSMREEDGDSNEAADTGSAVHFAVAMYHTHAKGDSALAASAMRAALDRYPLADCDKAETQFHWYCKDSANACEMFAVEKRVAFTIPAAPFDPTKEAIYVIGTLDQIRRVKGKLWLWDIKTGSPEGPDMVHAACLQLCAYWHGAEQVFGEHIHGCGIIRTKDYVKTDYTRKTRKPGPVFYEAPWTRADVLRKLSAVQNTVADIRSGRYDARPGEDICKWCRFGIGNCTS